MNKLIILLSLISTIFAFEVNIKKVSLREFHQSISINAKVVELPQDSNLISSYIDGKVQNYFVSIGDRVKKGDKLVQINSIPLLELTTNYLSLKKQLLSQSSNLEASKKLYKKGLLSLKELNQEKVEIQNTISNLNTIEEKLKLLKLDVKNLSHPTSTLILYAEKERVVSEILKPVNSFVDEGVIMKLSSDYHIKAYLPIKYYSKVNVGDKLVVENSITKVESIYPYIDSKTQRVVITAKIDNKIPLGTFVNATLYLSDSKKYPSILKSSLSFFKNEWVVFVKEEEHEHKKEEHHEEHEEDEDDEHEHHHEEIEIPYEPKIVKILAEDEKYVAIDGLEVGDEYVSDKPYFIKSLLLKSSLGGHGH